MSTIHRLRPYSRGRYENGVQSSYQVFILEGLYTMETFNEMKETYGEDPPSYDVVKHWHCQFKCGWTSVEMGSIPGRPQSAIDDDSIRQVEAEILEDRRITVCQLAQDVMISVNFVNKIIHDHLHMWKLSVRWIPRLLTPFQKLEQIVCSKALLAMCQENQNNFFDKLIMQDETWVHYYDTESKIQSSSGSIFSPQRRHGSSPQLVMFCSPYFGISMV